MIKVNIGGMNTQEIKSLVEQVAEGKIEAKLTSDISGVQEVAKGEADYYIGACATGGGGAIAMAIAILGYSKCFTASMPGKPPREEEVEKAVRDGKKAFGFTCDHVQLAVPMIVKAILETSSAKE
ncbi:MAG: DUF2620 family protein [Chloroflexi bacterium]|jgi:hypothetical protein|nr:DUF2620 family protein [Chloroflexota bacterium]